MRDYSRLDQFLNERIWDANPNYNYEDENNKNLAVKAIDHLKELGLKNGNRVVDMGCGKGRDLKYMESLGLVGYGVNFLGSEITAEYIDNIPVFNYDQSFTGFENDSFDCVYSRHCLEHSIMPYFTLFEYNRILKQGGLAYIELPGPETKGYHETNPNHYAVMGKAMWENLFIRSGFEILECNIISFDAGENLDYDTWYAFFLRKKSLPWEGWFRNNGIWY